MSEGNEGDQIILFTLNQIGCRLNDSITSISQFDANAFIGVIITLLNHIIEDDNKVSVEIPASIASRHRFCTDIANRIKDLGYRGECSYNQLLYPVISHMKPILTYLVQKLPRLEDDQAAEVVGEHTILNRRIGQALHAWKRQNFSLSQCAVGKPLINKYLSHNKLIESYGSSDPFQIYQKHSMEKVPPEPAFFHLHSLDLSKDSVHSTTYEFEATNIKMKSTKVNSQARALMRTAISVAIGNSQLDISQNSSSASSETTAALLNSFSNAESNELMNKSLNELILGVTTNVDERNDIENDISATRFAHATEFSHEAGHSTVNIISDSAISNTSSLLVSSSNGEAVLEDKDTFKDNRVEKEKVQREQKIAELKEVFEKDTNLVTKAETKINNVSSRIRLVESELSSEISVFEALDIEASIKAKTLEMLPSAGDNIPKLQTLCEQSSSRIVNLSKQWESIRVPLIAKLRVIKNKRTQRRQLCKTLVEEMKSVREEMQGMVDDLKRKQERSAALTQELSKLPKNLNRTVYTHRIMDIIASINKQVKEINKITFDIHGVQKSINMGLSSLQRADAVAEDLVYSAANGASRDEGMINAYRQLRSLRANFDELINTVNKIGAQEKHCRQLETKIDQETARVSSNNFDQLKSDIEEVQQQNNRLVREIRLVSQ